MREITGTIDRPSLTDKDIDNAERFVVIAKGVIVFQLGIPDGL